MPPSPAAPEVSTTCTIVLVGSGPRGIAVLERLADQLPRIRADRPLRVLVIDDTEPGAGRIWRTDQPPWFLMNTVVGEVSMFPPTVSDPAALSFAQWLAAQPGATGLSDLGPDDYAPRRAYGGYLRYVLGVARQRLAGTADVRLLTGRVTALAPTDGPVGLTVESAAGRQRITADAVVLATGHGVAAPSGGFADLAGHARAVPGLQYIGGQVVGDLPLDRIQAGAAVGVIGMGLSFYDVALSLTLGRDGEFRREGGRLTYLPSGKEPILRCGSRSGMPLLARGVNQKSGRPPYTPRFFTPEAISGLREAACRTRGNPALDFADELLPLLTAEINLVRHETAVRNTAGTAAAAALVDRLRAAGPDLAGWAASLSAAGLRPDSPLNILDLARPFRHRAYRSPAEFAAVLTARMATDLAEARLGNVHGPLKAALDVIRDVRDLLRSAVEFGGLGPGSHRDEFDGGIAPLLSFLSTGPPPIRTEQFLALAAAGVVRVVGPRTRYAFDPATREYRVESPQVTGSRRGVSVLLDTRTPASGVHPGGDPLLGRLVDDGHAQLFVNSVDQRRYPTRGLCVTAAESRLGRADGPGPPLYALGIPTEGVRWFTQIGNGRPGVGSAFHREADAIAVSIARRLDTP